MRSTTDYQRLDSPHTDVELAPLASPPPARAPRPAADALLQSVYRYYVGHGKTAIVTARIFELLTLAFVIVFFAFVTIAIEYDRLLADLSADNRVAFFDYVSWAPSRAPFAVVCAVLFGLYWLVLLYWFVVSLPMLSRVSSFYADHVYAADERGGDWNLRARPWSQIAARVCASQRDSGLFSSTVDALDLTNIIMRQENFLLGLYQSHILGVPAANGWAVAWVPVEVPFVNKAFPIVTAALDYNYRHIVLNYIFSGPAGSVHAYLDKSARATLSPRRRAALVAGLRTQFRIGAAVNLVLMPFILVFLVFYFLVEKGEQLHSDPHSLSARTWSPYAKRVFRMYNELLHQFDARINRAHTPAFAYLTQFPATLVATVAKFVAFVVGSVMILFVLLSLVDQNAYFNLEISPDKSVVFYLGPAAAILAIARSFIPAPHATYDPASALADVAAHTRLMPRSWAGDAGTREVLTQFSEMFQYKVVLFAEELISVVLMPFLLFAASLSDTPARIVAFFDDNLEHVDGLGHVCKPARFQFDTMASPGASLADSLARLEDPTAANADLVVNSFVNFAANHPQWEPCPTGSQLLHSISALPAPLASAPPSAPASPSPSSSPTGDALASQQWLALYDTFKASLKQAAAAPDASTADAAPPLAPLTLPRRDAYAPPAPAPPRSSPSPPAPPHSSSSSSL